MTRVAGPGAPRWRALAEWLRARATLCALAVSLACLLALGWFGERPPGPDVADAQQYLAAAYHLAEHGVFSEARQVETPPPGIGREPGYGLLLAALMKIDPRFADFDPGCLGPARDCDHLYAVPQWVNAALFAAAGFLVFLAARILFGNLPAAFAAGAHIWLNHEAHDGMFYMVSDYLAVFLVALTTLALVWACHSQRAAAWAATGATLAALTLTKAVFLYFALPVGIGALAALAIPGLRPARRRISAALVAAGLAYAAMVGPWMARNLEVGDAFAVTFGRGSIALSTREALIHMSPQQYAAALVVWTRGFGDSLAKRLFPAPVLAPFDLEDPQGFYLRGQLGHGQKVQALEQSTGLSREAAEAEIDRQLMDAFLSNLPAYVATTIPVFYRGIWIDEFIVVSLPGLVWVIVWALRRRRWDVLFAVAPGVFSLTFYALTSLNIPRYQLTALPGLAVATGFVAWQILAWLRRRRGARVN